MYMYTLHFNSIFIVYKEKKWLRILQFNNNFDEV